jgi:hypothetical protein
MQKRKQPIVHSVTYMHLNIYNRLRVELRDPRVPSRIFLLPQYKYIYQINLRSCTPNNAM